MSFVEILEWNGKILNVGVNWSERFEIVNKHRDLFTNETIERLYIQI